MKKNDISVAKWGRLFSVLLLLCLAGVGGSVSADALKAMFATAPSSGSAPLNVSFIDISEGEPVNWTWSFNDSSSNVTKTQNPTHLYEEPGEYYPRLVVDNNTGLPITNSSYTAIDPIVVYPPVLMANFTRSPHYGYAPLNVGFIDQSTGPVDNYTWDFDVDNTDPATPDTGRGKNPNHTYVNPGSYRVNLTISDNYSTASIISENFTVYPIPPPEVDFSASPRSGTGPLEVVFTSLVNGTGPFEYEWNFGDETPFSIDPHPVHTYTHEGDYNVTVGVTGAGNVGNLTVAEKRAYISVSTIPAPIADFYNAPHEGIAPLSVSFIGLANGTGNLQYTWDFGDGIGTASGRNPNYTYNDPGFYDVTCTVSDGTKQGEATHPNCVRVLAPPLPAISFSLAPTNGDSPLNVTFMDLSTGLNATPVYDWTFGDGNSTVTTDKTIVYSYENEGTWIPRLNVTSDGILYPGSAGTPVNVTRPQEPKAMFAASPRNGTAPLEVAFIDQSEGKDPVTWYWDFGDGSISPMNYVKNPVHVYEEVKSYNVSLMIHAANGDNLASETNFITVQNPVLPNARFTATPVSGTAPLNVSFIDQSTGEEPLYYTWDFGDNSTVSHEKNPVHQYTNTSSYSVNLTVANNVGVSNSFEENYITVGHADDPIGMFTASPRSGSAPLTVSFIDQSKGTGPFTHKWDFGDGTPISYLQNPVHTYLETGKYDVKMQVIGPRGSDVVNLTEFINVTKQSAPIAGFVPVPTSGPAPLNVSFIDTSFGDIVNWNWDFGDGNVSSIKNPSHVYALGNYSPKLTITDRNGLSNSTMGDIIKVYKPGDEYETPVARFSYEIKSDNITCSFTDESLKVPSYWKWDFGDGNISYERNPVNVYPLHGLFKVTLSVSNPAGVNSTEQNIELPAPVGDVTAGFTLKKTGTRTYNFVDASSGPILTYVLSYGDGLVDTFKEKWTSYHIYTKMGYYNASLTVTNGKNSDTSYQKFFVP